MRTFQHQSLTAALGVRRRELVALVGGGGKSGALQLLALEALGGAAPGGCAGPGCAGPGGEGGAIGAGGAGSRGFAGEGAAGARMPGFLATTTTGMYLGQLQTVGPVVMAPEREHLVQAIGSALAAGGAVAAARDLADNGKVVGVPPEWVDELWAAGVADLVVVEADGSRGLSLKVFGRHEPQVPGSTTLVV